MERLLGTKGLNVRTYMKWKGLLKKRKLYRVGTPLLVELRHIRQLIPDAHKKLVEIYFKVNREVQRPAINETSMEYQNFDLARMDRYFHVSREVDFLAEGTRGDTSVSIDRQGRYQPRVGGNQRINIRSFTAEVMGSLQDDAAYVAMTIPLENARTLLASTSFREAMKNAGHQRILSNMTTMLRRMQGVIADQSAVEMVASDILAPAGKSILSLRFSGALVQMASVPAAVEFIDKKYFMTVEVPTRAEVQKLKEMDPVLWLRWEAKQFDFALGLLGAQNAFETLLFDHTSISDKFVSPYTWGDQQAIWKIYKAAERKIEAETKLKRGTPEFQQATLDLLHDALDTQPQWGVLHRSIMTSSPNPFVRALAMFMSARNAQFNVLLRAIDDKRKGRIDLREMAGRFAGVGMANVLVSVARHGFRSMVKAGAVGAFAFLGLREPPDKDELADEAKRLAVKLPIEMVFNLAGLNAWGALFNTIGYQSLKIRRLGYQGGRFNEIRTGNMLSDITLDVIQTGIDFHQLAVEFATQEKFKGGPDKGEYKWMRRGKQLAGDIGLLVAYRLGMPFEGPMADFIWPAEAAYRGPKKAKAKGKRPTKIKSM